MREESHTFNLIRKNRYWTNNPSESTHLLMSGGMIKVPEDNMMLFFDALSRDVKEYGCDIMGVLEQGSPVTRFFLDIDFKYKDNTFQNMEEVIKSIFLYLLPIVGNDKKMFSLTRDWAIKGSSWHKGYHIIFPEVFVDLPTSMGIREKLVAHMDNIYPEFSWEEIIDADVILSSNLRMVYAAHYSNGVIDTSNHYRVDKIFSRREKIDVSTYTPLEIIRSTHIRLPSLMKPNVNISLDVDIEKYKKKKPSTILPLFNDQFDLTKETWKQVFEIIRSFVYYNANIYKDICIQKITSTHRIEAKEIGFDIKKCYHVTVYGSGSKFCLNKKANHHSANIYFRVTRLNNKAYICQRCFCKCKSQDPELECRRSQEFIGMIDL